MSSTKRPGRAREADDFYRTPRWTVDVLLDAQVVHLVGPILEPGCGDGSIIDALQDHGFSQIVGVEAHRQRASTAASILKTGAVITGDFLEVSRGDLHAAAPAYRIGCAVGNPPFRSAEGFIWKTLDLVRPGGAVVFLLRLAFLSGQKRAKSGLWNYLESVHILPRRPSFTGNGTDSSDYAWFVFRRYDKAFQEELRRLGILRGEPAKLSHLGSGR